MSERYRVEQTGKGFWPYCVRAGNGTRDLYVGHKKTCDRVAAELTTAFRDGEFVGKGLYDALAAETQALREQVKALQSAANSWQSGYDEGRRMGTKHRQSEVEQLSQEVSALRTKLAMAEDAAAKGDAARHQCGGMEMEIEELRAELAELRARVVVVPERLTNGDSISRMLREIGCDGDVSYHHAREIWNACIDELSRINGKTVSEGLLRRLARPADRYDEVFTLDRHEAAEELRALLSEQEGGNDVSNHQ
ncbi:TPA: hypothetical protein ACXKAZ_000313 [Pseudomonas aeruginosa]|uniref:hypothetical protein n=1 Tax=Pseudomonas aeruginosa TaxID=287 RepID=UPI00115193B4|nr:hypothetical protein [Pseudomonas aeruginosa]MBF3053361.1 hypothetical protein [Pseudomonas aeruginosa]MDC9026863.1 hypothetical protein [Pseudomonas aeruginosa]TQI24246.1 hypothetical protein FLI93_00845 [Pseudomonas aeruginosa]